MYRRGVLVTRTGYDDHAEEEWRRTALDGAYGEIYCVCFSGPDGDLQAVSRGAEWQDRERVVLETLNDVLPRELEGRRPYFIGHNLGFDLRFLFHRFVINNIKPAFSIPYNATQWSGAYFDTMFAWSGARGAIKLTELAEALGMPAGNDINGSEVWDAVLAGRHDEVMAHCQADVERVRQVHRRLTWQ